MSKVSKPITSKTLSVFWHHAWQYPRYVLSLFVVIPITVLVNQYLPPLILAHVLNRLSKHDFQPHRIWASFGPSLVLYAVLMLFGGIVMWRIVDLIQWRLEAGVERDMGQRVFGHLLSQSANFHANTFGGSLVSQTNKLLSAYIRFADTTVFMVLPLLSGLLWASLILAKRAPLFVVLLIAFSIFYIASSIYITRHVRRLSGEQAAAESEQTGYLADAITNVMAIKSFAGQSFEQRQFNKVTNISHSRTLAVMHGSQKQMIYLSSVTNTISAVSLTMAVVGVMVFNANLATVFLILSYTTTITSQLWNFGTNALRNYNRAFGDASDMAEKLHLEPEIKDPVHPEKSRIKDGVIDFKKVIFTHDGANEAIFHDLSLHIASGEKIGLVGHSGSGKTTLTRVLLRFSELDGGEILIDDQNIAHLTQDDLHRSIAYVPQEPIMFHRSLMENIRYGQFDARDKEVVTAARVANAHEFITQLPAGYETLVGERGVKLSGGQRQRIAIARAMLKNAPILVLDEATSALDSESEALIQDALWKLMEGRTAIVIAHRLSTIQRLDRIVVLSEGQVVEQGTHKQLLKRNGIYAQLWQRQSGGFIDE